MAKPMSAARSSVYRFTLTDENARVMNLNGLNWVMTLLLFSESRPLTITMQFIRIGEIRGELQYVNHWV